jgi:hypothetical protein
MSNVTCLSLSPTHLNKYQSTQPRIHTSTKPRTKSNINNQHTKTNLEKSLIGGGIAGLAALAAIAIPMITQIAHGQAGSLNNPLTGMAEGYKMLGHDIATTAQTAGKAISDTAHTVGEKISDAVKSAYSYTSKAFQDASDVAEEVIKNPYFKYPAIGVAGAATGGALGYGIGKLTAEKDNDLKFLMLSPDQLDGLRL